MEISPLKLTFLLLFSFLYGGTLGVLNDVNRIIRVFLGVRYSKIRFEKLYAFLKLPKSKEDVSEGVPQNSKKQKLNNICLNILIFFQDILLMLFLAIGIILLGYYFNDGRFRIFTLLALVLGFVIYYFTIGKLVMIVSEPIMLIFRAAVLFIFRVLSVPIIYIAKLFLKFSQKIYLQTKKRIAKRRNIMYNKKESERLMLLSKCGFLDTIKQKE